MDTLIIDEKSFVKASKIAKDLGYTSDYVGQLCRGKKVEAKLVGRTWYVERDSINFHKENRYKKHVSVTPTVKNSSNDTNPVHTEKTNHASRSKKLHFYTHTKTDPTVSTYKTDNTELYPGEKKHVQIKTGKLSIDLADANTVKVNSKSNKYDFSTPLRKKLTFKGSIPVNDIPEIHPIEPKNELRTLKEGKDTESVTIKEVATHATMRHSRSRSGDMIGIRKKEVLQRNPHLNTLAIPATDTPQSKITVNRFAVTVTTVMAVLVATMMLGLETRMVATDEIATYSYSFTVDNLLTAVYGFK